MTKPRIVLASGNQGKLAELGRLLAPFDVELVTQATLNIHAAVEDGHSFVENALIKARHAAKQSHLPALADDSGLAVDALNGKPGIHSARFSGSDANDERNNDKLLKLLEGFAQKQRSAQFHCALVYVRTYDDPAPIICQGLWHGEILTQPRGTQGFGYDPLFYVPTHQCTSAELSQDEKNRISHRGLAMRELVEKLRATAPYSDE